MSLFPEFKGIQEEYLYRLYPNDIWIILIAFCVLCFVRNLLLKYLFTPIANLYNIRKNDRKYKRLMENGWYAVWYIFSFTFGLSVLWKTDYIWDWNLIGNYPHVEDIGSFRYFYLINFAFCLQMLMLHLCYDTSLDDFNILLVHHIVTILLVSISYVALHHRGGSMVFLLHDFVDIFLYGAKVFHYLGHETTAAVLFVTFAVSMLICRLIAFPIWIFYILKTDNQQTGMNIPYYFYDPSRMFSITQRGFCLGGHCIPSAKTLAFLLMTLVTMHVYWFYLVVKMIYRIVWLGAPRGDIREMKEIQNCKNETKV